MICAAAEEVGAVCAFIEARPVLLHQYPDTDEAAGRAWPSRRSWQAMARVLAYLRRDDTAAIAAVALGLVGDGAGSEFLEWRASMDLPAVADVIADPSIVAGPPHDPTRCGPCCPVSSRGRRARAPRMRG